MEERIAQEILLLRKHYSRLEYRDEGRWFYIPGYPLQEGWNRHHTDVAFQVSVGYPAAPPYGIYVPAGLTYKDQLPSNYNAAAALQPPFEGKWGIFSWTPNDGQWHPTAELVTGSNLLNWVASFAERFKEGL